MQQGQLLLPGGSALALLNGLVEPIEPWAQNGPAASKPKGGRSSSGASFAAEGEGELAGEEAEAKGEQQQGDEKEQQSDGNRTHFVAGSRLILNRLARSFAGANIGCRAKQPALAIERSSGVRLLTTGGQKRAPKEGPQTGSTLGPKDKLAAMGAQMGPELRAGGRYSQDADLVAGTQLLSVATGGPAGRPLDKQMGVQTSVGQVWPEPKERDLAKAQGKGRDLNKLGEQSAQFGHHNKPQEWQKHTKWLKINLYCKCAPSPCLSFPLQQQHSSLFGLHLAVSFLAPEVAPSHL